MVGATYIGFNPILGSRVNSKFASNTNVLLYRVSVLSKIKGHDHDLTLSSILFQDEVVDIVHDS